MIQEFVLGKTPAIARRIISAAKVFAFDVPTDLIEVSLQDRIDGSDHDARTSAYQKLVDCDFRAVFVVRKGIGGHADLDDLVEFITEKTNGEPIVVGPSGAGGRRVVASHPTSDLGDDEFIVANRDRVLILLTTFCGGNSFFDYIDADTTLKTLVEFRHVVFVHSPSSTRKLDMVNMSSLASYLNPNFSQYNKRIRSDRSGADPNVHRPIEDDLHWPYLFNIITDLIVDE